jgi:hypothetical protein
MPRADFGGLAASAVAALTVATRPHNDREGSSMTQAVFWSWLRVFAVAAGSVLLADVADGGFSGIDWEAIAIAGVLAVGPVILNWLNPNDQRYGKGSDVGGVA